MKKSLACSLLNLYVDVCVMVGAVWVSIGRRRQTVAPPRQDLEALIGGVMIAGAAFTFWFVLVQPLIEVGSIGDGIEGLALGGLVGYIVTGIALASQVLIETSGA